MKYSTCNDNRSLYYRKFTSNITTPLFFHHYFQRQYPDRAKKHQKGNFSTFSGKRESLYDQTLVGFLKMPDKKGFCPLALRSTDRRPRARLARRTEPGCRRTSPAGPVRLLLQRGACCLSRNRKTRGTESRVGGRVRPSGRADRALCQ